jgi:hypothetical protein
MRVEGGEVFFQLVHPFLAELTSPFPSDPIEYLGTERKHLHAKSAASENLGTAVVCVGGSFYMAGLFKASSRLCCRLLAHPETTPELADCDAVGTDGLSGEAVDRSCLAVAALGQFGMEVVDDRPEGPG